MSTELVTAETQAMCLNEWIAGGGLDGRKITIGGITSLVSKITSLDSPKEVTFCAGMKK